MKDEEDLAEVNEKYSNLMISDEYRKEMTHSPNADKEEILRILKDRVNLDFFEVVELIKERVSFFGIYDCNERVEINEAKLTNLR